MYKNNMRPLTIDEINSLADNSEIYLVFLDGEEWNLESANKNPLYIYEDGMIWNPVDGFEYETSNLIQDVEYGEIKVYKTPKTKFIKK